MMIKNLSIFISLVFSSILTSSDLSSNNTFLVFLYYSTDQFKCPSCAHFEPFLNSLKIPVKKLNFIENVELGSRFLQYSFPSFIIRDNNRSYVIHPKNGEDLLKIVNTDEWGKIRPRRPSLDTNSYLVRVFAFLNVYVLYVVRFISDKFIYVPTPVMNIMVVLVILYLVYSIVDLIKSTWEISKEKTE